LLFVSHDMSSVASLTDQCLWIHQGTLRYQGQTKLGIERYGAFCQEAGGYRQAAVLDRDISSADSLQGVLTAEHAHCDGLAELTSVELLDEQGLAVLQLEAGESIQLLIKAAVHEELFSPFIGYQICNDKGQVIFADNTLMRLPDQSSLVSAGLKVQASFLLDWPCLAAGDYSLTVAISSGSKDSHVNHHWVHDALFFSQGRTGQDVAGIFSPVLKSVSFDVLPPV